MSAAAPPVGGTPAAETRERVLGWARTALPLLAPLLVLAALPMFGIDQEQTLIRATPFILTALAVTVPARAGLINVGGEGQLFMGAAAGGGLALSLEGALGSLGVPVILLAGAAGGMAWATIAAALRLFANVNEIIATLLLNYIATLFLAFLVHGPWKDPESFSFPITAELAEPLRLATLTPSSSVNIGIFVALAMAGLVFLLVDQSRWGFRASVVGGNPEAARRAGFSVNRTLVTALLLGGALAGLAGVIEVAGIESRLRPDMAVGFGYIGFLASWLVGHHPLWVITGGITLAAIAVYGDSLQLDHGLPAKSVYIVMAGVLLIVLAGPKLALRRREA